MSEKCGKVTMKEDLLSIFLLKMRWKMLFIGDFEKECVFPTLGFVCEKGRKIKISQFKFNLLTLRKVGPVYGWFFILSKKSKSLSHKFLVFLY